MSNQVPTKPDVACPVPDPGYDTYRTDLQSNYNVSRKDKFLFIMDIPELLKPFLKTDERLCNSISMDRLQMNIWGHVVPDIQKPKIDVRYGGQTFKTPSFSTQTYPTVTVNYTIDNRFDNYLILYKWLNLINDESMSIFDAYNYGGRDRKALPKDYTTTVKVYALDEYDKPIVEFTYFLAFPTGLGSINTNHKDSGEI